jgi:predicted metal-dependent peptidase
MKGKDKLTAGRVQLLFNNVFFGALATAMGLHESQEIPTAATDGKRLLFNPEFTDKLNKSEIIFLLAHEVLHIVLLTHVRRGHRDPKVWNMATDFAINQLLIDEKFTMIEGGLHDDKYKGWAAEKIYEHLMDNPEDQPGGEEAGWNVGGVMDAGSIDEDGKPTNGGAITLTPEQIKSVEAETKTQIQAAAMSARKAGQLPASMERLIDQICAPRADWKTILQRFICERAFNDWEAGTCHTRMLHQYGVISPKIGGEALGEIAVIVDTSGSIRQEELAQFAGEINDVTENYDCKITVIYIDTEINRVDEFGPDDDIEMHAVGGGGTCQKAGYDWVAENIMNPSALIHFTDSYVFDWDKIEMPSCPALMACHSPNVYETSPAWLEVIDISQ